MGQFHFVMSYYYDERKRKNAELFTEKKHFKTIKPVSNMNRIILTRLSDFFYYLF